MDENDILTLFQKVNIEIGQLDSRIFKGWFDTDCEDLLKWICTSITEECCISPQQENEFAQLDKLPPDELDKQAGIIETMYPDIFDPESIMYDISNARDTVEMLNDYLKDCNHQVEVNEQIHQNLLAELSRVNTENMQNQVEMDREHENCMKLSKELDEINQQTFKHIEKYSSYLVNYDYSEFPAFANNMDITEFKEKFSDTTSMINSVRKIDGDLSEMSYMKFIANTLTELESRIFHSRISKLVNQMEVEALQSVLNFFDNLTFDSIFDFLNCDSLVVSIENSKSQEACMLKEIEEKTQKFAEQLINQPALRCLKNELHSLNLKLNHVNKFKEGLTKILSHFVIMHCLYLQEKEDIKSSSQFFKNVNKYINTYVKESTFRKESMLKRLSQYEDFSSSPIENQFKLIGALRNITSRDDASLKELLEINTGMWRKADQLKKLWRIDAVDRNILKLRGDIQILQNFLISGPTLQVIVIPISLREVLLNVDQSLLNLNTSIKFMIRASQEPKVNISKNKWLRYQNLLWTYFMTDPQKMLSFLDQLKMKENMFKDDI